MNLSLKNLLSLSAGLCLSLAGAPLFASSAQDYDQAGMALFNAGQYEKSIQYFSNAVQTDPTDWQAYEDMGDAYLRLDDKPNALASYQKALQLNPGNSALQTSVDNLNDQVGSQTPANDQTQSEMSNSPAESQEDSDYAAPEGPTTIIVRHFRRHRKFHRLPNFNDNLALMDHAPIWFRAEFGYDYSAQTQLINSANATNTENTNGDLFFNFTSGHASMSHNGFQTGGEIGFLLNPTNGIAIGARFIEASDYNLNAVNSAPSTFSNPNDFENATFSPRVVPITLDYYLFLPDHSGRFFVTGGIGYYFGAVQVNENYSLQSFLNNANAFGNPYGNLNAGNIGFQIGAGRDFAVTPFFGVSLYARAYFAQISNFQGTLSDGQSWALVKFSDKTVDIDDPSNIGSGGEKAATIDFTGFDIGASLNFFTF